MEDITDSEKVSIHNNTLLLHVSQKTNSRRVIVCISRGAST